MNIRRRIAFTKGLPEELAKRVHRENDLVTDMSTVLDDPAFDDKYVGARALKLLNALNAKYADIVDISTVTDDNEFDTKLVSARQLKVLKDAIDAASTGLVFRGSFDIGTETAFPASPNTGDLYKIVNSVDAGTSVDIDGINLTQGDSLFRGTSAWIKIDNTESADILRDGDISIDADFTVDPDKLTTRSAIKTFVDNAVNGVSYKFTNETVTITSDAATLAHTVANNTIFMGIATIDNGDGTFDQVQCSVVGDALTIAADVAGEYDGKDATVTYAYV